MGWREEKIVLTWSALRNVTVHCILHCSVISFFFYTEFYWKICSPSSKAWLSD